MLVHLIAPATHESTPPTRAGFVVSRAVGGAVVRNQVKRRLRALLADRLPTLPAGSQIVTYQRHRKASGADAHSDRVAGHDER